MSREIDVGVGGCGRCLEMRPLYSNPYGAVARCAECRKLDDTDFHVEPGGLYRHHKGGLYRVICMVRHHESGEAFVAYLPYQHPESDFMLREVGSWCKEVPWPDGSTKPRFVLETFEEWR